MNEKETINKTIKIKAPKERVWEVLLQDKYFRQWSSEFAPDSYADTDWNEGSRVEFKGRNESGLFGKVIEHRPNEFIAIQHQGVIDSGADDTESFDAQQWQGTVESYEVYEEAGLSVLSIKQIIPKKYVNTFYDTWDNALDKIKELAEADESFANEEQAYFF